MNFVISFKKLQICNLCYVCSSPDISLVYLLLMYHYIPPKTLENQGFSYIFRAIK